MSHINCTQKQLDSLYEVYKDWQNHTPSCNIMPETFTIIPPENWPQGRYIGVWVGQPRNGNPGSMFIGIEADGHRHS